MRFPPDASAVSEIPKGSQPSARSAIQVSPASVMEAREDAGHPLRRLEPFEISSNDELDGLVQPPLRLSRLDVFGSVSRGDDRDDSDVDLLYELAPDAELGWEIDELAAELEGLLGRPVDPSTSSRSEPSTLRYQTRCSARHARCMQRDALLLEEMIDAIERITALTEDTSVDDLAPDRLRREALLCTSPCSVGRRPGLRDRIMPGFWSIELWHPPRQPRTSSPGSWAELQAVREALGQEDDDERTD